LFSLVSRSRSLAISALPVRISSCRRAVSVSVMGSPGLGPPRDRGGQAGSGAGGALAGSAVHRHVAQRSPATTDGLAAGRPDALRAADDERGGGVDSAVATALVTARPLRGRGPL